MAPDCWPAPAALEQELITIGIGRHSVHHRRMNRSGGRHEPAFQRFEPAGSGGAGGEASLHLSPAQRNPAAWKAGRSVNYQAIGSPTQVYSCVHCVHRQFDQP